MRKIQLFSAAAILFISALAVTDLSAKNKPAADFGNMARGIRVNRRLIDQLEDQTRILEYAVRSQQLTPAEERRIRGMMKRVQLLADRTIRKGSMTPSEAKSIQSQISYIYRTLWFLRINDMGKGQIIHFLGTKIILRERYRGKAASRLDQQEMAQILHTYYKACRLREQLKSTHISTAEKKRIRKECFTILSEYFTLAPAQKKAK